MRDAHEQAHSCGGCGSCTRRRKPISCINNLTGVINNAENPAKATVQIL